MYLFLLHDGKDTLQQYAMVPRYPEQLFLGQLDSPGVSHTPESIAPIPRTLHSAKMLHRLFSHPVFGQCHTGNFEFFPQPI